MKKTLFGLLLTALFSVNFGYSQNHALVFDGTGDYVSISDDASLDITSSITVEAWVKLNAFGDFGRILIKPGTGSNAVEDCAYFLGFNGAGTTPRFGFETSTAATVDFTSSKTVALNTWNHIAATYDNATGDAFLYLNGELVGTASATGTLISTATDLTLGASKSGTEPIEYELEGELDEVRIWSTAKSQAEIQASMYSQLAGSESNLEAYYQASDGSGSTLTDNSSNSNDGSFVNDTDWLNSGAPVTRTALDFDGVDEYVDLAVPALFSDMTNNDFTIETWVSFDDLVAYDNRTRIFSLSVDSDNMLHVMIASNTRPGAFLYVDGTWYRWRNSSGLSTDTWYHFAMSWDADIMDFKFYINGEEQTFAATSAPGHGTDNSFRLASRPDPLGSGSTDNMHLNGRLDEFRIWSTVRPQDSLIAYMHRSLTGTETGLVDYYTFDEGTGTTLTDITGGNDGSLVNMESGTDWIDSEAFFTNTVINASATAATSQLGAEFDDSGSSVGTGESVAFKGAETATSNTTSDLPAGVVRRFVRTWKAEVTGTTTADLTIDFSDAISGLTNDNTSTSVYSLLYRSGTSGSFSEETTASSISDDQITFSGVSLQDGYYTLAIDYISWHGSSSTDWNTAANWTSNSVPTSSDNIWIPSAPSNQPHVTSNPATPAECGGITVQSGATLTIEEGKALTASGDTDNEGTILIEADATGIGSFIDNGTITGSGSFQMEQYLTGSGGGTPDGLFWYVSSPVASATSNVYNAAGTDKLWSEDETTTSYPAITNNATPLAVAEGYVARLGSNSTLTFSGGAFNTGDVSASGLTRTGTTEQNRGYNLVGNPYPSTVDWDDLGRTNLETTMWYRTHNGSTMLFDTYNATGMVGTNNNGGGTVDGTIPPTQAFWVRVDTDGNTGQLDFENADRSHGTLTSIYKTESEEGNIRLTLSDGNVGDEQIILFNPAAQDGFDDYDSHKFWASNVPQLYSNVNEDTLTINGLYSPQTNPTVPLGLKIPSQGDYTLDATSITFTETPVHLEDTYLNVFQDLNSNPIYAFTSMEGNISDRFILHFSAITGVDEAESDILIYSSADQIHINRAEATQATVTVLDLSGKTILTENINTQSATVQLNAPMGIYLVRVETENQTTTKKLTIR